MVSISSRKECAGVADSATREPPRVFNLVGKPAADLHTCAVRPRCFADSHENTPPATGTRNFTFSSSVPPRPEDIIVKTHDNGINKSAWRIQTVAPNGVTEDGRSRWQGTMSDIFFRGNVDPACYDEISMAEIGAAPLHLDTGLLYAEEIRANPDSVAARLSTERGIAIDPQLLRDISDSIPGFTVLVLVPKPGAHYVDFFDEAFAYVNGGRSSYLLLKTSRAGMLLTAESNYATARDEYLKLSCSGENIVLLHSGRQHTDSGLD